MLPLMFGPVLHGLAYSVVTSKKTGRVWLDRNLGARQVCTSSTDEASFQAAILSAPLLSLFIQSRTPLLGLLPLRINLLGAFVSWASLLSGYL
jgi:hypothetical protein